MTGSQRHTSGDCRGFLGTSLADSGSKGRSSGAGGNINIMEPEYADMDRARVEKKARR